MLGSPTTHLWLLPLLLSATAIPNLLPWDPQIPFPHTDPLPLLQWHVSPSTIVCVPDPMLLPSLELSIYYFFGPFFISSRIVFWLLTTNSPYFPSTSLATPSQNPLLASFCLFLNVSLLQYTNQDTLLTSSSPLRYLHSFLWFSCHPQWWLPIQSSLLFRHSNLHIQLYLGTLGLLKLNMSQADLTILPSPAQPAATSMFLISGSDISIHLPHFPMYLPLSHPLQPKVLRLIYSSSHISLESVIVFPISTATSIIQSPSCLFWTIVRNTSGKVVVFI